MTKLPLRESLHELVWRQPATPEFIKTIADGSSDTFDALVEELNPVLTAYLGRKLRDIDDRDDAVADTWGTAFTKRRHFAGQGSFGGWILAIARRVALMSLRSHRRASSRLTNSIEESCGFSLLVSEEAAFAAVDARATLMAQIRIHINGLAPRQAAVLVARSTHGEDFDTIADRLHIRVSTARATFRDAVRNLKTRVRAARKPSLPAYTQNGLPHPSCYADWHEAFLADCGIFEGRFPAYGVSEAAEAFDVFSSPDK
jgi:RNA polymerase sigma factor (sigma-70 family)